MVVWGTIRYRAKLVLRQVQMSRFVSLCHLSNFLVDSTTRTFAYAVDICIDNVSNKKCFLSSFGWILKRKETAYSLLQATLPTYCALYNCTGFYFWNIIDTRLLFQYFDIILNQTFCRINDGGILLSKSGKIWSAHSRPSPKRLWMATFSICTILPTIYM